MLSLQKVNDEKIVPFQTGGGKKSFRGDTILPDQHSNVFLLGRKRSGKTTVLWHILKKIVGKLTVVFIFCPTVEKDDSWMEIVRRLEQKNITVETFPSLVDEDGEDKIEEIIDNLTSRENMDLKYPEVVCVFDDISSDLKNRNLPTLVKMNRHLRTTNIFSSQYVHDLPPGILKNVDLWLIFKGQPKEKLEKIYKDSSIGVPKELFFQIYHHATGEPYSFLYLDAQKEKFRKGLSKEYRVTRR